ncbi:RnfH family protein [Methylomicrobium sp. Wu6]|uniref:RnfH family protein n=1 Tax=Methylomicrobium sp. Wu6 TaxID=3107928 RepID=UPI002DD68DF6|nr:RnfH family protein [Methylomicrobium sp. Wu6]MEC4749181.1 RnfH family protein [Methylomicrobium sp. Wu6]
MVEANDPSGVLIVEVVYATSSVQALVTLKMPPGATVREAIEASGFLQNFADIDLAVNSVGIFGKVCSLDQTLRPADRIEIYRPLLHDPKEARRQRAVKK